MNSAPAPSYSPWRGVVAVATTFVFFLLFAQFAFLDWLQRQLHEPANVERAMAAMGVTGLATSLATSWWLRRVPAQRVLTVGFLICAATALSSTVTTTLMPLLVVSAAIGAGTALITVALATDLRSFLPGPGFGLRVGLGTGIAYAACNLPSIFDTTPERQAVIAAAACMLGWGVLQGHSRRAAEGNPGPTGGATALTARDVRGLGFISVVLSFLALIWMDSAAFAVIQETAPLKAATWQGPSRQLIQGVCHLVAAVFAGLMIDRGHFRSLLLSAFAFFSISFSVLDAGTAASWWAGPLYAVGISFYSVALVAYPAYRGDEAGTVPRRWRAGAVFGIGGWLGSALGVGMAQELHHIPRLFILLTGLGLGLGWLLTHANRLACLARAHAQTGIIAGAIVLFAVVSHGEASPSSDLSSGSLDPPTSRSFDAVRRGRRVYIQEGCINCHSQYSRPRGSDARWFGPHRPLDRTDAPPLIGNRRQGPDLTNVGARRNPTWQRLHLINPRALAPTSRMPAYGHLFNADTRQSDSRGDDLVAYLGSLGRAQRTRWVAQTHEFTASTDRGDARRGGPLFGSHCAPCHGTEARGDGPFAAALPSDVARRAMNLRKGPFWSISWGPNSESQADAVARMIRYGMPGTDMPGHEYLPLRDIDDLTAFVESLTGLPPPTSLEPWAGPEPGRRPFDQGAVKSPFTISTLVLAATILATILATGLTWFLGWLSPSRPWMEATGWSRIPLTDRPSDGPLWRGTEEKPAPDVRWLGHAGFLIEWYGVRLLLDPNVNRRSSIARRRVVGPSSKALEAAWDAGDPIDVALISHAHYDHLDLPTLHRIGDLRCIVVPSGSERYLPDRLRRASPVVPLEATGALTIGPLEIRAVPARHNGSRHHPLASGLRAIGYIIRPVLEPSDALYLAGDTGFGDHFATIGARYRPRAAILPIGAFAPRFPLRRYHLNPEEAVAAALVLGVESVMPCHFGTFTLSLDRPSTALPRFAAAARASGVVWRMPLLLDDDRVTPSPPLGP